MYEQNNCDLQINEGNINENVFGITKVTMDLLLKQDKPSDLIALYTFYCYTCYWQNQTNAKSTTAYTAKGMHWSEGKVRSIKSKLKELGLIKDVKSKSEDGTINGWYVKVNYITKKPHCGKNHTVEKTTLWKIDPQIHSTNNKIHSTSIEMHSTNNTNTIPPISPKGELDGEDSSPVINEGDSPAFDRVLKIFTPKPIYPKRKDDKIYRKVKSLVDKKILTRENLPVIEEFYRLPKSKDYDKTWNRKLTVDTLLNNWMTQVEIAMEHKRTSGVNKKSDMYNEVKNSMRREGLI